MRKWTNAFLMFTLCAALVGCSSAFSLRSGANPEQSEPGIQGYIVKIENGRFLVVSSVPKDFSSTGGAKEFYNAIWFSNAPNNIQIGHQVKVWFDNVNESYPGQSKAVKLSILPNRKPERADLTEAEAVRRALAQQSHWNVPVIRSVTYDEYEDAWTILVKEALPTEEGKTEYVIQETDQP
jgi:hypothetical protein